MNSKGMFLWLGLIIAFSPKILLAEEVPILAHEATLTVTMSEVNEVGKGICSPLLQNCMIQVTQYPGCQLPPGSVTITNNSRISALNIQATSTNPNFNSFVVQNNGCAPVLAPGTSCVISFYTNSLSQFFVPNISVKGTNTNATFFDLQAIQCIPQAQLSVAPSSLTFDISGLGEITITNQSTTVDANNLQVVIPQGSSITVDANASTCVLGATLPRSSSCSVAFRATTLQSNVPVSIQSANSQPVQIPVSTVASSAELSLSATNAVIPVNSSLGINVQVNNASPTAATGVHFDFSGTGWSDVTSTTCTVPPNGSCMLNVQSTSLTPHLAQAGILLAGDNLSNPPTIAFAFSLGGGLIFGVDSGTGVAKVVSDVSTVGSSPWSPSTTSVPGAQSPSDGVGNTDAIMLAFPGGGTAASYCNTLTAGGANPGDWYLPAICEWSNGAFVTCGIDNIVNNLYNLGFGNFQVAYWSSTEITATPSGAWGQQFISPGDAPQFPVTKTSSTQVLCARMIPTI